MKVKTKTVSERLSAVIMAGVLATSMMTPAMAFAADATAGYQTGTGATALNMVQEVDPNRDYGGTADDTQNPLPITDTTDPNYDENAPGKNLAFTVPSSINFVLSADGTLTGPTTKSFIENRSAMPIHASALQVKQEGNWKIVNDATASNAEDNSVDLTMTPKDGTAFNLSEFVSATEKKALAKPYEWNMTATDAHNGSGTDTKAFTVNGHATHVAENITSSTKFGEIHWYMRGGEKQAPIEISSMSAPMQSDGSFRATTSTFRLSAQSLDTANGSISIEPGDEVTVEVTPDAYNELDDVTVVGTMTNKDIPTTVDKVASTAEFTMPNEGIDIEIQTVVDYQVPMTVTDAYFVYNSNTKTAHISPNNFDGAGTLVTSQIFASQASDVEKIIVDEVISPSSTENWFRDLSNLKSLQDFEKINVTNVTNMTGMFSGCGQLADISALADWDTSNVTYMGGMFNYCTSLSSVSALADWDITSATDIGSMFRYCTSLSSVSALADWDTSTVTDMYYMFSGCSNLTDISALAEWDTSKVTSMSDMFSGCSNLTDISALANWDMTAMRGMSNMFSGCSNLTNISALAEWKTVSLIEMSNMFANCSKLTDISALAEWDTSKVTNLIGVFNFCTGLDDISALADWDTSSVTDLGNMFYNCIRLTDASVLNDWNTAAVTGMSNMFTQCVNLTAYPSWYRA